MGGSPKSGNEDSSKNDRNSFSFNNIFNDKSNDNQTKYKEKFKSRKEKMKFLDMDPDNMNEGDKEYMDTHGQNMIKFTSQMDDLDQQD